MNRIKIFLLLLIAVTFSCNSINTSNDKTMQVSADGHTLELADGTPFFWLGDTAWELFHRLDKKEADYYLETRKAQGFNVIQAVILAELNGLTEPNQQGDLPLIDNNTDKPNEKYFEYVDYIVNKAASLDMYMAILPTWGRYWAEDSLFTPENAFRYGEFLGKRYKDQWNVVWILGGDRIPTTDNHFETIKQMALGLKAGDNGKHLITFHPGGDNTSLTFFQNENWIDFHMSQSGHAHRDEPTFLYSLNNNGVKPYKPFIDGEPHYEDIPVKFWEVKLEANYPENPYCIPDSLTPYGYFNDYDVRLSAYWSVFTGAAGTTYGNGSVWCFWQEGRYAPIAVKHSWKKSMESPGGKQMQYLKKIIDIYGVNNLLPDNSVIANNWSVCSDFQAALITKDRSSILLYNPRVQSVRISKKKLSGKNVYFRWFNPRNGEFTKKQKIESESIVLSFTVPSKNDKEDWVLVVDSED